MLVRLGSLLLDHPRITVRRVGQRNAAVVTRHRPSDGGWTPPTSRVVSVPVHAWLGDEAVVDEDQARHLLAARERRIGDDITVRDLILLSDDMEEAERKWARRLAEDVRGRG